MHTQGEYHMNSMAKIRAVHVQQRLVTNHWTPEEKQILLITLRRIQPC
jgi:hypothetical protein